MHYQISKKRKKQLKNAGKRRKIGSGIGDKITKEGGAGEAGIQGSGDGLGESACPEPQDEAVCRCQETTSNNDGTTGSLRVVVIVLLSFSFCFFFCG